MIKDRHIGNFEVSAEVINDHPDVLRTIMGTLIVLRAENDFATATVQYTAICAGFEEVAEGEVIPTYDVEYDPDTEEVSWAKQ